MTSILDSISLGSTSDSRIIPVYGDIDEDMVSYTINEINRINEEDEALERSLYVEHGIQNYTRKPIYLDITTHGGSYHDGIALVSVVEQSKTPIITRIQGYAYSFGVVLFLAADRRQISKHADIMYHQLSTMVQGTLKDIEEDVVISKQVQERMEKYILDRSNMSRKQLKSIYKKKKDNYISAEEALELGIATEII